LPTPITLIVGLNNPGPAYEQTRHNAGAWLVTKLADQYQQNWQLETKFHGFCTQIKHTTGSCRLLLPNTFMNQSGRAVRAMSSFYQIPPAAILVVHDELDLPTGTLRLKQGGGHGGHNGLRDIIAQLGSNDFKRLRIGINHPGDRNLVHDYVLSKPSLSERQQVDKAINDALFIIPKLLAGDWDSAINNLHSGNI
jgi:PTH1 family peptidyl-tRNA hydrolase